MFEIKYLKDFVGSYVNLVKSYDCDKTLGYALNNLMLSSRLFYKVYGIMIKIILFVKYV